MLRQCIQPDQKDWVSKLPAIQFAINSARSASTGFSPFFLNYGRNPRSFIWNSAPTTEFAGVRNFLLQKKLALMSAHDSIIAARIKQTRDANRKRQTTPFKQGDLVYLSTQNISFQKGLARKLIPKYIGPYKILRDYGNSSFKLELPAELKKRGIHDVFHSSLLRVHIPSDDRLFPGRQETQLGYGPEVEEEWAVEEILSHHGTRGDILFEVKWKTGDITWLPSHEIGHLQILKYYLDAQGVEHINQLPPGKGNPPLSDPQIFIGLINFELSVPRLPIPKILKYSAKNPLSFSDIPPAAYIIPQHHNHQDTANVHMGKRQRPPPSIDHPRFHKQNRHVIQIRTSSGTYVFHVSQLLEFIQYENSLRTLSVDQAVRRHVPLGYGLVAYTWNSHPAPNQFATISDITSEDQHREIIAPGLPISMTNFLVTPEDCGIAARNNPVDSELQALTRYVALNAVYSRQRREAVQQQCQVRRAAAFGSTGVEDRNVKRRYNSIPSPNSDTSGTFVNHSFTELNQVFPNRYITLDEDETMSAPEPSTSSSKRSVSIPAPGTEFEDGLNALALANANNFPEPPHIVNDDLLSPPVPLDFSALGTEEPADHPSA
jgi:hypothetical protein